jgi:hypothetical protein
VKRTDLWEHAATVAIVACGVVLSIVWALTVPIFENPDEGAHFQYVLGIRTAGRLLLAREGPTTPADNATYLRFTHEAGLDRIPFHPTERVAPDYGSPAWISRVDATVPTPDPAAYAAPRHPIPALVTSYPPGYYALAALWMAASQRIVPGLVEGFFSVRFFSTFIFALTLFAAAALMREMRLDRPTRLLLLVALALFPLCSFVSASVQPDVLVGLFLTVLAHRILVYRRVPTATNALLAAALLFGCCLVKPVYTVPGLAAFEVVVVTVAVQQRRLTRRSLMYAVLSLTGFGLAYALGRFVAYQPPELAAISIVPTLGDSTLGATLARGPGALFGYVAGALPNVIDVFYFDGGTQASYWGVFGWLDAPLRFFQPLLDFYAPATAFAFRVLVAGLGLFMFCTVVRRCVVLARQAPNRAVALFLNDVPVTLLLFYDALMVTVALALPNFGYQGRYWYPVVVISMIASVRYAARLVPFVPQRLALQRGLAAWLCVWSLVASHGAAHTIRARYYGFSESSPALGSRLAFASDAEHRSRTLLSCASPWAAPKGPKPACSLMRPPAGS